MTARCYPEELQAQDGRYGEWDVWNRLRQDLPDEAFLLHSVRVPTGPDGREIDFLVLWPGVGLGVVEVKGGQVTCDPRTGWSSHRGADSKPIGNPMEQVATARHELSRALSDRGLVSAKARIQHVLVLPHSAVAAGFDPTDCPRGQVVDRNQLGELVPRLRALIETGHNFAPLDGVAVPALLSLFRQQLDGDDLAETVEHEGRADHLSLQQADVLDLLSRQRSFTIIGGAGCGKTVLALEQAKRLAKAGKRVALVCYSRGLGRHLAAQAATWDKPPAYVGLFHDLARAWGAPDGDGADYYETVLPEYLGNAARGRADLFDAVVVDEGQDFGELWWPSLMECLKDRHHGGVFVFLDEDQRVFTRHGAAPVDGEPYPLRHNFRNTKRIAETFGSLASERTRLRGRPGPKVRFVSCGTEDVLARADDAVDALLDAWAPHQIALLTTWHRHPEQKAQQERYGPDGYWDAFFQEQDVFYGSVSGFKGLERTCVVLAVNGFSEQAQAKEMLYVGLSRARSQLVVVGDLDVIASVGGGGVRSRLQDADQWQP